jgi:hypothetical protein
MERGLPAVVYLDTMLEGGTEAQMAATKSRPVDDLEILVLATFGDCGQVNALTKRFSLWT